jgi:DNA-binding IclR family transcriptional regulator
MNGTAGAQAIRRAMDVVRAVAQTQRSGATLSRIATATGLSKSTAFRILRSLTEERLLRFQDVGYSYHLGPLAFELGLATQSDAQIPPGWRECVAQVAQQTRLTTYLMARSDHEAVCLLCVQGTTTIRAMPVDVGQRLPLGIGAGSLAILATLDDAEINQIMAAQSARLALFPGGQSQTRQILERVKAARRHGFALSSGTVTAGLAGVGVAVQPQQGLMQLAVSVSAVAKTIELAEARRLASIIVSAIKNITH